jgi:Protein of unknown function (DUF3500)
MKTMHRVLVFGFVLCALLSPMAWAKFRKPMLGETITSVGQRFLSQLSDEQKKQALLTYAAAERTDWHFIPKPTRKGLQLKEMTAEQRQAAHDLFKSCLSEIGYDKAQKIISLEDFLRLLQKDGKGPIRDTERYYFTLFGQPEKASKWGISIEGHHMSFNFVIENEKVISFSPLALCTNPATVMNDVLPSIPKGLRILANEELIAFQLLESLTPEQKKIAIVANKAPAEVRTPGSPQPPQEAAVGIAYAALNAEQQATLQKLVATYLANLPEEVVAEQTQLLETEGWAKTTFAWMGASTPGIGHYYRVQGQSYVIELVNTQPDAAGNAANHVHCVWRNLRGDFAIPIK